MDVNKRYFICLILVLVFFTGRFGFAQDQPKQTDSYNNSFLLHGNISLDSITKLVHKTSGIRFSFNSVKVKGSKEINFLQARYSIQQILQRIKKTTSLYYFFYSGYVIFQDNPPKPKEKTVVPKINLIDNRKNQLKPNAKSPNKKLKPKSPPARGKDIAAQNNSQKVAVQQKPANTVDTVGNIPEQIIDTAKINSKLKQSAQDRSFSDSATAIVVEKDSMPLQLSKNISMGDTTKFDSSRRIRDSSIVNTASPGSPISPSVRIKNRKGLVLHYGVQWNINMPVYGFKEYFTGINGSSQPYNFLIPGLWISKIIGKKENELLLMVKPEQQYFTGNKVVANFSSPVSVLDSIMIRRNTIVIKTNSITAGLQYKYHLNDKWNIGGGLNFNWQYAALINQQTTRLSSGVLLSDSLYGIKKSSQDWKYFKSPFVTARLEAAYNLKKFAIGCAVYMPITSIFAASVNNSLIVNGHIFILWKIN
jgi:hypothetical protein